LITTFVDVPADDSNDPHAEHDVPRTLKIANAIVILMPMIALVAGCIYFWGRGFSWMPLILMTASYLATGLGITIGYHRLFTHRAFETSRGMKIFLAVLGSMACEGPLLRWCATHRRHHQHSDEENDPHSPHLHGGGWKGFVQGLAHSHIGWLFAPHVTGLGRYVGDLRKDPALKFISRHFVAIVILGLIIPAVIGGLAWMSWQGALVGFIWGGLVRIMVVHHFTWSVNSVCHLWGSQTYETGDHSRNNPLFGILSLGEGWHNNHHAFPTSARHGLAWWQFDLSYSIIRVLERIGVVWRVKVPDEEAKLLKLRGAKSSVSNVAPHSEEQRAVCLSAENVPH